ncbi:unnamed protein product [Rhodiola kirilowii]
MAAPPCSSSPSSMCGHLLPSFSPPITMQHLPPSPPPPLAI